MSKYECPLCGAEMTEEEGLYWCDPCGINNEGPTYLNAMEQRKKEERESRAFVGFDSDEDFDFDDL